MDNWKTGYISHLTHVIAAIAVVVSVFAPAADAEEWVSWTSFGEARRMRVFGDTLYAATSGGLLVIHDPRLPGVEYTNLDGLGTADITDIIEDADGQKWVTGYGRLVKFDGVSSTRYPFEDNEGASLSLYCVRDDGDYLWVGTSRGLVLFSKTIDGGLILDGYEQFGDLDVSPGVLNIELDGNAIWLATTAGLATADRTNHAVIKGKTAWTTYSPLVYPELAEDTVTAVMRFENTMYVGTSAGLYRLDVAADTLVRLSLAPTAAVRDLQIEHDSLFVYSEGRFGVIRGGVVANLPATGLPSYPRTGAAMSDARFVGIRTGGLYYRTDSAYATYPFSGLPANDVVDVSVTKSGRTTLLLRYRGPYELVDGQWVQRSILLGHHAIAMGLDREGWNWVGTWGSGASRVGDSIVQYTQANSALRGVSENPNYIVVMDAVFSETHVFMAVYRGIDDVRAAVGDLSRLDNLDGWGAVSVADSIDNEFIVTIDYFGGQVLLGSEQSGLYWCFLNADPVGQPADSVRYYRNGTGSIPSNVVRVARFSPAGEPWVGTNLGLVRYDRGIDRFVDIVLPSGFGPDITALEFDSRGNAWIGATNGLARIDAITSEFAVYTVATSGLIDDNIANVEFDQYSGDVYVCTSKGLSILPSTIGPPVNSLDSVYAFPNPFVIRSSDDRLSFNFARSASLRVFTVAGELVLESPQLTWDGRNQAGEPVASGVYLFVLTDAAGEVGRGKVLLVRK